MRGAIAQSVNPEEMRTAWLDYEARLGRNRPGGMVVEDTAIARPAPDGGEIAIRIYRPEGAQAPGPCVVYLHGGAFIKGSLDTGDAIAWGVADETGVVMVSVDYRLASQHPFQAGPKDCYAAVCYLAAHGERFGVRGDRLGLWGDSAGGDLPDGPRSRRPRHRRAGAQLPLPHRRADIGVLSAVCGVAGGGVPEFRRVVIETTGLADPAPILHTLLAGGSTSAPWAVEGVVTTMDAVSGRGQLSVHPESVKQAAVADRLLVTKSDLAEPSGLAARCERLRTINPGAPILTACHGDTEPAGLFDAGPLASPGAAPPDVNRWLGAAAAGSGGPYHHNDGHNHKDVHDDGIRALSLSIETPVEIYRFIRWVEQLLERNGGHVLRLKGILNVAGDPLPVVVHGVQHVFHPLRRLPAWPDADRCSRLVLIVKDLDIDRIEREFRDLVTPDAAR